MEINEQFFEIEIKHLPKGREIFGFNLYLFNPNDGLTVTFLHANAPLNKERIDFLNSTIKKGAKLVVKRNQKRTFLKETYLEEKQIKGLLPPETNILSKNQVIQKIVAESDTIQSAKNSENYLQLKQEVSSFLKKDEEDFSAIIIKVRDQVCAFNKTTSPCVSLAIDFCQKLLKEDNSTNRIVALAYCFAQMGNINQEKELADIICASYLHHIGLTQLDAYFSSKAYKDLTDKNRKQYQKHPFLAFHLVKKSKIEISDRCLNIILDHHERSNGSGFPNGKREVHLDNLTFIVGAASHIVEYSEGKITGKKTKIKTTIQLIEKQSKITGLEINFGRFFQDNIVRFFSKTDLS